MVVGGDSTVVRASDVIYAYMGFLTQVMEMTVADSNPHMGLLTQVMEMTVAESNLYMGLLTQVKEITVV